MRSITLFIATVLLTGGLLGVPPAQSTPSTGTGDKAGTATGAQEPASSATMHEEPAPPTKATDIQERRVRPGLVTPGVTLQITAPTPSLTAIRNAIQVTSKGVSVNLRIPANLPVTVPVEVSVAYVSPAQAHRRTKIYNPATGLTILYHEAEGDGKPRAMGMDITVRELVPNGQSFSISKQLTIIPLYKVTISSLKFIMVSACDLLGKADITLVWNSPDNQRNEQKFKLNLHDGIAISRFRWQRKEISTQDNLLKPTVQFFESDLIPDFGFNPIRSGGPLVPGQTEKFHFFLDEKATGPPGQPIFSGGCQTEIIYAIARRLMTFDQF